jgi:glycosyltransferase involved in cell wall biosynthesis
LITEIAIVNSQPLVSVCIPTYNGALFLRQTIASVVNQTYKNLQIVISDHSSTDGTLDVIKSFDDSRIEYHTLESRGQASDNWNFCCSKARGQYVQLVCQDDLLHPVCIERHIDALEKSPENVTFSFSRRDIISPSGRVLLRNRGWNVQHGQIRFEESISSLISSGTNLFGEPCAVVMRREFLQATSGFTGKYLIDLNMWLELWQLGPALNIAETLCQFRISKSSWTSRLQQQQSSEFAETASKLRTRLGESITEDSLNIGISHSRKLQRQRFWLTWLVEKLRI